MMRLMVTRAETSKSGVFGGTKREFQVRLQLQLSPDEQDTVEKFDLQEAFSVNNPVDRKSSFTYLELIEGKTISADSARAVLIHYDLVRTTLDAANNAVKTHQLFPGEAVIDIS
jgi:hypothetical protein